MAFVLHSEKIEHKAFEIFEALDFDNSFSSEFFKEKCAELPYFQLIDLRDKRLGNEGRTLLHNAARKGSVTAVLTLLRMGHVSNPVDSCISKVTPLMDAILNNNIEVSVILVEHGASLTMCDINGENSFHYCARAGSSRLLRSVISASRFSKELIMTCASSKTIKQQLPEDLAKNAVVKEILKGLRENGYHPKIFQNGKETQKNYLSLKSAVI
jgi:ankyrin repeat protein